jgi:hypothetical protein
MLRQALIPKEDSGQSHYFGIVERSTVTKLIDTETAETGTERSAFEPNIYETQEVDCVKKRKRVCQR